MSEKIHAQHLERKVILYVRQSSPYQVVHNVESQKLQYAMQARLRQLGWQEIEVVDDDLGRSAAGSVTRAGFERMVAEVCLGKVGAVAAREVSRFARNSRDWQQLVEVCRVVDTVLIDQEMVYAPRLWSRWQRSLILVRPETVVGWHRAGFKLYWTWLSRHRKRAGRKCVNGVMHVRIINFGTNWWAMHSRNLDDPFCFRRSAAWFNSAGLKYGRRLRLCWVYPGQIRFNLNSGFQPEHPLRSMGRTFLCSGPNHLGGRTHLLFVSLSGEPAEDLRGIPTSAP